MLILIILICTILVIIGTILEAKDNDVSEIWATTGFICGAIAVAVLIIVLMMYPYKVEEKLAMYTEENTNIENKVKETVGAYMDFEKDTYQNLVKTADLTTLLIKYPELNSNELVKAEIGTYKENNSKIKELKEQLIMKSAYDWWLYFGGRNVNITD